VTVNEKSLIVMSVCFPPEGLVAVFELLLHAPSVSVSAAIATMRIATRDGEERGSLFVSMLKDT
jgi:hypothetical protein